MMDAGVWAFDCETNHRVQVIERIESWGFVSYRVYDAEKETVSIVPAARPRVRLLQKLHVVRKRQKIICRPNIQRLGVRNKRPYVRLDLFHVHRDDSLTQGFKKFVI